MTKRKYFGTDGIRGVAGVFPLDPETVVRLGKAIAHVFMSKGGRHKILIGKDTRLSGYMLETALASGITSMGADALIVGPIPTPGVSYLTRSMRVDAGIMVSASHNPFADNGIKIFGSDGFKLDDSIELQIEELLDTDILNNKVAPSESIGKATRIEDAIGRYTVYLKECFPRDCSLDGFKIGFDAANGAGYVVGAQVLHELGADIQKIGNFPNGKNINDKCGSLYPEKIAELVIREKLSLGIALDGDADRVVLVDEKGEILDGDEILAIIAKFMKDRGELTGDKVVATVMTNVGIEKYLKSSGIELLRSQVGDRYVLEEMQKSGAIVGGEQSGHTIFRNLSTTGDGILTALVILSIICKTQKSLSQLKNGLVKFPQLMESFKVSKKPSIESIKPLQNMIFEKEKKLGDNGRILIRYSGTEDKIRVMVECDKEAECKKHLDDLVGVIRTEIG